MKRKLLTILISFLVLSLLAGCAGPIVVVQQPTAAPKEELAEGALKTYCASIVSSWRRPSIITGT